MKAIGRFISALQPRSRSSSPAGRDSQAGNNASQQYFPEVINGVKKALTYLEQNLADSHDLFFVPGKQEEVVMLEGLIIRGTLSEPLLKSITTIHSLATAIQGVLMKFEPLIAVDLYQQLMTAHINDLEVLLEQSILPADRNQHDGLLTFIMDFLCRLGFVFRGKLKMDLRSISYAIGLLLFRPSKQSMTYQDWKLLVDSSTSQKDIMDRCDTFIEILGKFKAKNRPNSGNNSGHPGDQSMMQNKSTLGIAAQNTSSSALNTTTVTVGGEDQNKSTAVASIQDRSVKVLFLNPANRPSQDILKQALSPYGQVINIGFKDKLAVVLFGDVEPAIRCAMDQDGKALGADFKVKYLGTKTLDDLTVPSQHPNKAETSTLLQLNPIDSANDHNSHIHAHPTSAAKATPSTGASLLLQSPARSHISPEGNATILEPNAPLPPGPNAAPGTAKKSQKQSQQQQQPMDHTLGIDVSGISRHDEESVQMITGIGMAGIGLLDTSAIPSAAKKKQNITTADKSQNKVKYRYITSSEEEEEEGKTRDVNDHHSRLVGGRGSKEGTDEGSSSADTTSKSNVPGNNPGSGWKSVQSVPRNATAAHTTINNSRLMGNDDSHTQSSDEDNSSERGNTTAILPNRVDLTMSRFEGSSSSPSDEDEAARRRRKAAQQAQVQKSLPPTGKANTSTTAGSVKGKESTAKEMLEMEDIPSEVEPAQGAVVPTGAVATHRPFPMQAQQSQDSLAFSASSLSQSASPSPSPTSSVKKRRQIRKVKVGSPSRESIGYTERDQHREAGERVRERKEADDDGDEALQVHTNGHQHRTRDDDDSSYLEEQHSLPTSPAISQSPKEDPRGKGKGKDKDKNRTTGSKVETAAKDAPQGKQSRFSDEESENNRRKTGTSKSVNREIESGSKYRDESDESDGYRQYKRETRMHHSGANQPLVSPKPDSRGTSPTVVKSDERHRSSRETEQGRERGKDVRASRDGEPKARNRSLLPDSDEYSSPERQTNRIQRGTGKSANKSPQQNRSRSPRHASQTREERFVEEIKSRELQERIFSLEALLAREKQRVDSLSQLKKVQENSFQQELVHLKVSLSSLQEENIKLTEGRRQDQLEIASKTAIIAALECSKQSMTEGLGQEKEKLMRESYTVVVSQQKLIATLENHVLELERQKSGLVEEVKDLSTRFEQLRQEYMDYRETTVKRERERESELVFERQRQQTHNASTGHGHGPGGERNAAVGAGVDRHAPDHRVHFALSSSSSSSSTGASSTASPVDRDVLDMQLVTAKREGERQADGEEASLMKELRAAINLSAINLSHIQHENSQSQILDDDIDGVNERVGDENHHRNIDRPRTELSVLKTLNKDEVQRFLDNVPVLQSQLPHTQSPASGKRGTAREREKEKERANIDRLQSYLQDQQQRIPGKGSAIPEKYSHIVMNSDGTYSNPYTSVPTGGKRDPGNGQKYSEKVLEEVERKHYSAKYMQQMQHMQVQQRLGSLSAIASRHGTGGPPIGGAPLQAGPSATRKQNDLTDIKNYLAEYTGAPVASGANEGHRGMTYYSHLRREIEGLVPRGVGGMNNNEEGIRPATASQSAMNHAIGLDRHGVGSKDNDPGLLGTAKPERYSYATDANLLKPQQQSALAMDFATWQRYRR